MKHKLLISIVITGLLFICGCTNPNEVQLSPRYQQLLEMSAVNVKGICGDCQTDMESLLAELNKETPDLKIIKEISQRKSCEQGLKKASDLLSHIVDASYGRAD